VQGLEINSLVKYQGGQISIMPASVAINKDSFGFIQRDKMYKGEGNKQQQKDNKRVFFIQQ
jgi:hypothetical protein